ncbi:putative tricarboxylic transport membrane protein [Ancylobacter aquaticus]|uniref:Putative tricarboxylic transport membrane protein n=1 Tax=Ancylobacter aquaticus TaxID=100 RepID=A0A4R1IC97_ANCAQ|nr:tripartite tricarboxylate transporter substrate binding protein [Ancylobacter aquaticus]TCK31440.1 putative tricarboxylic transport membrane protein [Ancylobacter aquaticus]
MTTRIRNAGALAFTCALSWTMAATVPALAQTEMRAPKGPIEITVGSGAGGSPDVIMRTMAKIMNDGLVENPIVVQNRTGGGHSNAYNYVLGKKGDENVLLTLASPVFTTPIVQGTPSVIDQVTPIAGFVQSELVLLTNPDGKFNTLEEFVAAAKEQPGRVRIAGGASGGNDHLATALVEQAADIKLTYIPHESGSAAQATFLGGNVEGHFATLAEGLSLIESGKAKPLAILSEKRRTEPGYKDVPTAKEQGVDVVYLQFWGVAGPPGLDPAVAAWWADKFQKASETQAWKDTIARNLQLSTFYGLDDAGAYFKREQDTFRRLLTSVGLAKN